MASGDVYPYSGEHRFASDAGVSIVKCSPYLAVVPEGEETPQGAIDLNQAAVALAAEDAAVHITDAYESALCVVIKRE